MLKTITHYLKFTLLWSSFMLSNKLRLCCPIPSIKDFLPPCKTIFVPFTSSEKKALSHQSLFDTMWLEHMLIVEKTPILSDALPRKCSYIKIEDKRLMFRAMVLEMYNTTSLYSNPGTLQLVILVPVNLVYVVAGLIGNLFVIAASYWYNSLKLEPITLLLIRSISMTHIIFILTRYIPTLVVLVFRRWVFGRAGCSILGLLSNIPTCVEMFFIFYLSSYRVKVLTKPYVRRSTIIHPRRSSAVWVIILTWLAVAGAWCSAVFTCFPVVPGPPGTGCVSGYNFYNAVLKPETKVLTAVFLVIFYCFPLVGTLVCNTYIMVRIYTRRRRVSRDIPGRTLAAVHAICLSYVLSNTATVIYSILLNFNEDPIPLISYVCVYYMEGINILVNPIIYGFRQEFRHFVHDILRCRCQVYQRLVSLDVFTNGLVSTGV